MSDTNIKNLLKYTKDNVDSKIDERAEIISGGFKADDTLLYNTLTGNIKTVSGILNLADLTLQDNIDNEHLAREIADDEILTTVGIISSELKEDDANILTTIDIISSELEQDDDEILRTMSSISGELKEYTNEVSGEFERVNMHNAILDAKGELSTYVDKSISNALTLSSVLSFKGYKQSYTVLEQSVLESHPGDIWLVGDSGGETDEYIYTGDEDGWKLIGNIKLDRLIQDYALSADVQNLYNAIVNQNDTDNGILSDDYNSKFGIVDDKIDYISGAIDDISENVLDDLNASISDRFNEINGNNGTNHILSTDYIARDDAINHGIDTLSDKLDRDYWNRDTTVAQLQENYVSKTDISNLHIDIAYCNLSGTYFNLTTTSINLSDLTDNTFTPNGKSNTENSSSRTPNFITYVIPDIAGLSGDAANGNLYPIKIPHFDSEISEEIEFWETLKVISKCSVLNMRNWMQSLNTDDILAIHKPLNFTHKHNEYDYNISQNDPHTTDNNLSEPYFSASTSANPNYVTFMFKIKILKIRNSCKNIITLQDWFETTNTTFLPFMNTPDSSQTTTEP